jgi:hypothetical protein
MGFMTWDGVVRKEPGVVCFKVFRDLSGMGRREFKTTLGQDSRVPRCDSNTGPPEYEVAAPTTTPLHLVHSVVCEI